MMLELIKQELEARTSRQEKIIKLIESNCEIDQHSFITRERWQDFCFQTLFSRTCHASIPFSTYLNQLMPQLGFPLGFIHTKIKVYRGLKWKNPS